MFEVLSIIGFAALPIVELRGAIPYAIITLSMNPVEAFWFSVLGNLIPVVILLILLPWIEKISRKNSKVLDTMFSWWFSRVISRNESTFKRWGALALIILVAIPLPITGAWTGSVAAYLFEIKKPLAFLYITIGVIIAGGIVTFLTISGIKFL